MRHFDAFERQRATTARQKQPPQSEADSDMMHAIRGDTERQMFVSLAEQSTEFIGICDMNFMPFFINDAGRRIVGLDSLEQALNTPVKEFFFPEDQQFIYEQFFPRVLSEGRAEVEIRFRHFKTGRALWMIYNVFHVLDSEGKPIGLATVSRNITERKEMEERLRESQVDLNRAQAVGHIGSWRFNLKANTLVWSAENHRIFGIAEGTPLSYETLLAAVPEEDRAYVDEMWHAGLKGESYVIEHRLIVDDQVKWVRETAELEFDEKGVLLGAFGTTQDITARKEAETALQEADRRKNEFLAVLAHELRNPLTPIRNALDILKRSKATDPAVQAAHHMIDLQVNHMVRLIDDLMDVSRISRGKQQLHREPVDLSVILEQAVEAMRLQIEEAGVQLYVALASEPVYLDADPVRLNQVFTNLLNNACKFTDAGGVIDLRSQRQGGEIVVTVADTGVGIAPENLPVIFEIFSQVPATGSRMQSGLGIGLSLARGLVEMHGGSIEARSEGPGKGSEFVVRLPVIDAAAAPRSAPSRASAAVTSSPLRILVAEDNKAVANSLVMLLELCGHTVATAKDGLEAVAVAERLRPDVLLLDIGMPRLDGYGACQRIRAQPWGRDIRIFALTGLGQEGDLLKSREAGFTGHLVKPFDPAALLQLLAADRPPA